MPNNQIKELKVKELLKSLDLDIVNPKFANINKVITGAAMHRVGLELASSYPMQRKQKNVVAWGTKESKWFSTLKIEDVKFKIKGILSADVPLLILSLGMKAKYANIITEIANGYKTPVVKTNWHLREVGQYVGEKLHAHFAPSINVHGALVVINGIGVMIVGDSGIGKSEAVLSLIQNDCSFISDDTVVLKRVANTFVGSADPITKGFLEARGIGFVDVANVYGNKIVKSSSSVELVIELKKQDGNHHFDRLGNKELKYSILEGHIPKMVIPVKEGKSVSNMIIGAVNVFLAKRLGSDPMAIIKNRIMQNNNSNSNRGQAKKTKKPNK